MPFEPLETDEKLEAPVKRERDMDGAILFGCSSFLVVALLSYALAVWPHFLLSKSHLSQTLLLACVVGFLPALGVGAVATRKFGLAAACGFVAGAMASAIFLFLRLEEMMLGFTSPDFPRPDYPAVWVYLLPLSWLLFSVATTVLLLPRGELPEK